LGQIKLKIDRLVLLSWMYYYTST